MSRKHMGSSIDDFLRGEGIFEEAQNQAVKEVVAWRPRSASQPLCARYPTEISVEGAQRDMPSLPRQFQHQAIRKTECRLSAKEFHRRPDRIRILQHQVPVNEQHLDRPRDVLGVPIVNAIQNPYRLGERQHRDPRSAGDKRFCGRCLPCVVPRYQADQNVGVNGAHSAFGRGAGSLPATPRRCAPSESVRRIVRDGYPRS